MNDSYSLTEATLEGITVSVAIAPSAALAVTGAGLGAWRDAFLCR